jgi:uncharacterized protein (DUF2236 family)
VVVLLAACTPPERDYDEERILEVNDLEELMYVHATVADRRFRLARRTDPDKLTQAQFAEFVDMGQRLGAAARTLPKFSEEPEFHAYAKQMGERAGELERAAKARDGKATVELAGQIRQVCAACHDKFR